MITLTHKKRLHLPFKEGCKVRAINDTKWYKIGAVGNILDIIKHPNAEVSLLVEFTDGDFDPRCEWFGPKSDFVVIG